MIRILLPHILRTDVPLNTGPLPMRSAAELSQASEKLIQKVISGKVSVSDALGIANLMEHRRHIIETEDHEERLRAIEQSADEKKTND